MISLDKNLKVHIYNKPVDMRKSIDGLCLLVVEGMDLNPQQKALYLFRNNACDKVKAILWDKNGFILLYKRLEKGRFIFPKDISDEVYEIDADLFQWLLKGFDFYAVKEHPELKNSQYF